MTGSLPSALDATRRSYDRLAPIYDLVAGPFEWGLVQQGLGVLQARVGERVLELGHGTGRGLLELAHAVGPAGKVVGVDLSPRMADVAAKRLERAGVSGRVELVTGDALAAPFGAQPFDAAFSAFTLETFAPPAAAALLARVRGALHPGGRLAVVSMATGDSGPMSRLYAWSHRHLPALVDCAPMDAGRLLREAGFLEVAVEAHRLFGIATSVTSARAP